MQWRSRRTESLVPGATPCACRGNLRWRRLSAAGACKFAHRVESATRRCANSLRSKPARSPILRGQSRTSASLVRWLNMVPLLFLSMLICGAALLLALFGVSGAAVVSVIAAGTALVLAALILRPWLRGSRSKRITWSRTLGDPAQGQTSIRAWSRPEVTPATFYMRRRRGRAAARQVAGAWPFLHGNRSTAFKRAEKGRHD